MDPARARFQLRWPSEYVGEAQVQVVRDRPVFSLEALLVVDRDVALVEGVKHQACRSAPLVIGGAAAFGPLPFVVDADVRLDECRDAVYNSASMKTLTTQPHLVEQVRDAILGEITSGAIAPGDRIIQEQIAQALGVSRYPVQQALALLRNQGVLQDAPRRGLLVAPLDPEYVQHMYDIRAVIEGLAARRAAELGAMRAAKLGPAFIEAGRKAVAVGSVTKMIAADMRFHEFIYSLSGNSLIAPMLESHLTYTQRMMGEVLIRDEKPRDIWDQHEAIMKAIAKGDAEQAEVLVRTHLTQASGFMVKRLSAKIAESARDAGPSAAN